MSRWATRRGGDGGIATEAAEETEYTNYPRLRAARTATRPAAQGAPVADGPAALRRSRDLRQVSAGRVVMQDGPAPRPPCRVRRPGIPEGTHRPHPLSTRGSCRPPRSRSCRASGVRALREIQESRVQRPSGGPRAGHGGRGGRRSVPFRLTRSATSSPIRRSRSRRASTARSSACTSRRATRSARATCCSRSTRGHSRPP